MSTSTHQNPTTWESFGVLAGVLAPATALPGWESEGFSRAAVHQDGAIEIFVHTEEIGQGLAARLDLVESSRRTFRGHRLYASQDTRELTHVVWWKGTTSGHEVAVMAQWYSPLGDLDLAEGEELA
jgi:hypothetical protein